MSSIFGGSQNQSQGQSASSSQSSNQAYPMLSNALGGQVNTGTAASGALSGLLGLGGNQAAAQQGFQNFQNSTGYQFGLNQGSQAITQNKAAAGLLDSGSTAKALDTYGQNYADTQYGNYTNQLQSLIGSGNQAGSVIGSTGNQSTSQSASQNSSNGSSKPGLGGLLGGVLSGGGIK